MTDCSVDAEALEPEEYEVLVGDGTTIAPVSESIPVDALALQGGAASALLETHEEYVVNAETLLDAEAEFNETEAYLAEMEVAALTGTDKTKLDGLPYSLPSPNPRPVWKAGEKSLDASFNSIPWEGADEYREVARGVVFAPELRNHGYLDIDASGLFENEDTPFTGTFRLETMPFPNHDTSETWTAVSGSEWVTPDLGGGAGTGKFTLRARLRAAGHDGSTFTQAMDARIVATDLAASGATPLDYVDEVAIDTTDHVHVRLVFKADAALDTGQTLTVTSTNALVYNGQEPDGY